MDFQTLLASGVVESYCLGQLRGVELKKFVHALASNPDLESKVRSVQLSMSGKSNISETELSQDSKKSLFEKIRAMDEPRAMPNLDAELINPNSCHLHWKGLTDNLDFPNTKDPIHLIPIRLEEKIHQFLAWVKDGVEHEVHTDMIESFLLLEGICECQVGTETHSLTAGSFLEIPLHTSHSIKVTTPDGIFAILQRIYL